jgi:transketolase
MSDVNMGSKGIEEFAKLIRLKSLEMVHRAKSSHIGSALSIADIIAALYESVLSINPKDDGWPGRDRFILSKGHACVAVYAALAEKGFFPVEELETYAKNGSRLMAHISHHVPGVELSTGSLGHGIPVGVGKAMQAKLLGKNWRTFVLVGDGELNEGSNWEALMFASHHKLSNLTVIVDENNLQSLTTTDETIDMGDLQAKFEAFGANVSKVNGHDVAQLVEVLSKRGSNFDGPKVVIAKTVKGKGVDFMENSVAWHYQSPNDDQLIQARNQLMDNR